jgi:hypothetical protein
MPTVDTKAMGNTIAVTTAAIKVTGNTIAAQTVAIKATAIIIAREKANTGNWPSIRRGKRRFAKSISADHCRWVLHMGFNGLR